LTEKWKGYLFRTIARKGHFWQWNCLYIPTNWKTGHANW
jgi:hypothetical protein